MAFSINDIKANFRGGVPSHSFQVQLTNPIGDASADRKLTFMAEATRLPESTLGTTTVSYFGRDVKYAGDRTFSPWPVEIINDEDFLIRNALETWSARINSLQGNKREFTSGNPALYKSQATVTQFSRTGQVLRVYQFNGIWPEEVSGINLNWAAKDELQRFSVTFQYDDWNIVGGITGNAGGL
jgi:hypothetical protein